MISKHISFKEATRSHTAKRYGIRNAPNDAIIYNMKILAERVFEPLRNHFGVPIKVNSFYRSQRLNKVIGGSSESQHCKGQAIDIDDTYGGLTNKDIFEWIVNNLDYDQIIWEFGNTTNPDWVHVSYVSPEKNRNRKLKALRKGGRTIYEVI